MSTRWNSRDVGEVIADLQTRSPVSLALAAALPYRASGRCSFCAAGAELWRGAARTALVDLAMVRWRGRR